MAEQKTFTGRAKIFVNYSSAEITAENVAEIFEECMRKHEDNRSDIQFLEDYKKGVQKAILERIKSIRPDIDIKVVVNIVHEISEFWSSALFGKPIQYLIKKLDPKLIEDLAALRNDMTLCDKDSEDLELNGWLVDIGIAYRLTLPNDKFGEPDEPRIHVFTPDPKNCFVAFHNDVGKTPAMCCKYVIKDEKKVATVWTEQNVFTIIDGELQKAEDGTPAVASNEIGKLPIEEHERNRERMGVWEKIIPLQDAINIIQSDRANGLSQQVQSILAIFASNLTDEEKQNLKESDGTNILLLPKEAQIKMINEAINQSAPEMLFESLRIAAFDITNTPRKNGGQSTSDTGTAVSLREGWVQTGVILKKDEKAFVKSERRFLKTILAILRIKGGTSLELKDIEIRFTPMLLGNLLQKANIAAVLDKMQYDEKDIAETCELFLDIEGVVSRQMARKERDRKLAEADGLRNPQFVTSVIERVSEKGEMKNGNGNQNNTGQTDGGSNSGD
jgi:SPP1 family phage portal protein